MTSRRKLLQAASTLALGGVFGRSACSDTLSREGPNMTDSIPDIIFHNGEITTLDRANPVAHAVAIKDGKFLAVGSDQEVLALAGSATKVVDLKRRCVLPGLVDNHTHMVRGGLNYNLELRWDGVRSLADAMDMLKRQVANTPAPQWVRVVGGFTEHQFAEKRLPTIAEINAIAPDTPVFLLHLYDRALLNGAALRAVGYTRDTPEPPGGKIYRDANGAPTGLLLATPNATILYATLAKGPKLPFDYQVNSTRHFMRELNRLGVTGVIDAGGGFQNYPDDYAVIQKLDNDGQMTVRLAYNLFTQKPKEEKEDFLKWTSSVKYKQGNDYFRHNGAGEMLVFSAADFEDFRQPRPDLQPEMEGELEEVVRILAENRWPWRLHATYDETITRALDVFEKVNEDIPLAGINWFFDHAETISDKSIDRIAALGGGIAVQHRMAYQGEYFVERYGARAAQATPPVARILEKGVKVSAGTDATRVASYNPWVSLSWMVTGKTVGGLNLYPQRNLLDREAALRMWTENVAWFSNEEGKRGRIQTGHFADLIVPSKDYFSVPEEEISFLTADMTVVGGRVVYGAGQFA
ncbi:amidohydrolase, partial [Pseudomonas atacamensis]|uniref:amidohydrolase n=1 Tax=Pseudomonas atacamensis TaxID=2565368 RepID=UPI003D9E9EA7